MEPWFSIGKETFEVWHLPSRDVALNRDGTIEADLVGALVRPYEYRRTQNGCHWTLAHCDRRVNSSPLVIPAH
jgi:hypothetical protein